MPERSDATVTPVRAPNRRRPWPSAAAGGGSTIGAAVAIAGRAGKGQSETRSTKGARTRERILRSALALFAERGFTAVSLRDIAAHARITHAGLLHYFSGKDDVLATLMIERDNAEVAAIREHFAGRRPDEAESEPVLIRWVLRDIARNQRRPEIAPLYVKLSAEATEASHPAHEYFRRRYRGLRSTLKHSFAAAFAGADPPITDRDPAACAQQFVALADGLQIQWLLDGGATDIVASLIDYLTLVGIDPTGWEQIVVPEDPL